MVGIAFLALVVGFSIGYFVEKPVPENKLTYDLLNGQPIKATEVLDKIKPDLEQLEKNKYNIIKHSVEELITQKLAAARKESPSGVNASQDHGGAIGAQSSLEEISIIIDSEIE